MSRTVLSLKTLETSVGSINADGIDALFNSGLYGVSTNAERQTVGAIYTKVNGLETGNSTQVAAFGTMLTGTATATLADLTTTYTTMNAVATRLGTIDTLLDLSSVEGSTAYDTIDELSQWCLDKADELDDLTSKYLGKGTILAGTASFCADTAGDTDQFGFTTVTFPTARADANYKVFICPSAVMTDAKLGEVHVEQKTASGFKVAITGDVTTAFDWFLIPNTL